MKRTFLDRFIGYFSPSRELKRLQFKKALSVYEKWMSRESNYESAGSGRRWKGTRLSNASAEVLVAGASSVTRARFRDLVRNNAQASRAVRTLAGQIIGSGILGTPKTENLRAEWEAWCYSTQADVSGRLNFYGIQSLVARTIVESGSCLIRRQRVPSSESFVVPFKLQVLEPDFIDTSMDHLEGERSVRRGIEFDKFDRPVAYHLFEEHPGGAVTLKGIRRRTIRVPAEEIIHVYDILRPGQIEGMPWGHPVMMRLRDYEDYEDAQLLRQKIAACFTGFIMDNEAPVNQPLGDDEDSTPMSDKFEPGGWEVLPPGKDIKFASPPGVGSDFEAYTKRVLQGIAAGMGITYEQLTQDYSNVNFSSARMSMQQFQVDLDNWRWNMIIPQLCDRVWNWWVEAGEIAGLIAQGADRSIRWTAPKKFIVDPATEVNAMKSMVRCGFTTLSETIRSLGSEPDEHLNEMAADNKRLDELRLTLDTDPRTITGFGTNQGIYENDQGQSEGDNASSEEQSRDSYR